MKQYLAPLRWTLIVGMSAGLLALILLTTTVWSKPVFAAASTTDLRNVGAAPVAAETIYVVRRGDTLYSIARRFGTMVNAIVSLNGLTNPNMIYVGQRLRIPDGSTTPPTPMTPTPTAPPPTAPPPTTPTPTPAGTDVWSPPTSPIELFSPVAAGIYHSPIEIIGFSQTFEGNVNVRLTDVNGNVLAERNTIGGSVDGFDFFHTYIRFTVTDPIDATLEVFDISANDGSEISKVEIPLVLRPGQRVIDVNTPAVGAAICNPVVVSGYANTFEANVVVDLRQRNNTVIDQISAQGGNLGVYANFTAAIANIVGAPQPRLISAYEGDAAGLGLIDQTVIPVTLYPVNRGPCP